MTSIETPSELETTAKLPTFEQIRGFILSHQDATVCEIRDHFNQKGNSIMSRLKPGCKKKELVLAYGINGDFFTHLQNFMKQDYVTARSNPLACLISDSTIYTGPGEFVPIVLSVK
jgi:energy-converting hydrogenase Eha subunit F